MQNRTQAWLANTPLFSIGNSKMQKYAVFHLKNYVGYCPEKKGHPE